MTMANTATPRTPCTLVALAPAPAPFVVEEELDDAADKLTGGGAVVAFKDVLTLDATKVGPPPAPTLLVLGARYGTYSSGFKGPG